MNTHNVYLFKFDLKKYQIQDINKSSSQEVHMTFIYLNLN